MTINQCNHETYIMETGTNINYVDFMKPKIFIDFHEQYVGTVLKGVNNKLKLYSHFVRWGYMFFYDYLTDDQVDNGPMIWDAKGSACSL